MTRHPTVTTETKMELTIRDLIEADYLKWSSTPGNWPKYIYKALTRDGFRAIFLHRLGVWCKKHNRRFLAWLILRLMQHTRHCWIHIDADIDPGFLIAHVGTIGIGAGTRIGKNCDIRRNCSFGGNFNKVDSDGRHHPWVGDNVSVGVNAVIVGPVRVGSNSIIGANSVVNRDVPENVIVFGVPAKILKETWSPESGRGA